MATEAVSLGTEAEDSIKKLVLASDVHPSSSTGLGPSEACASPCSLESFSAQEQTAESGAVHGS